MTTLKQIVGAALLDSLEAPQKLLAARRTAPPEFAGMWEFPGGKIEPGERPQEALHREIREELGVSARLGAELEASTPDGWPLNSGAAMRVWLAEATEGAPEPLEDHDLLRWVELAGQEILELPWIPADLPIVHALIAFTAPQQLPREIQPVGVEKAGACARLSAEDPKEVVP